MKLANAILKTGLVALLAFCGIASGRAQAQGQNSDSSQATSPQTGSQSETTPAVSPKATKKEEDAYKAILDAQTGPPAHLINLGEAFVANFPMSAYIGDVNALLTVAYLKTNQTDKMIDAGAKALNANPDNVDVLSALAGAIPRVASASTPEGRQRLQQAEGYARHAINLLNTMAKPTKLDEATFDREKNDDLSKCYSGLGVTAVKTGRYADGVTNLTLAVGLASVPGMVDYYLLGVADEQTGQFTGAVQAFGKCAVGGSPVQSQCKAGMSEAAQKAKQGPRANTR